MKHFVKWIRTLACVALVVVLMSTAALPALAVGQSSTLATSGSRYIVTASGLNVRSGAGMRYSVITVAPRGTQVTYISNNDGWWSDGLYYNNPEGNKRTVWEGGP